MNSINEPFLRWLRELKEPAHMGQLRIIHQSGGWIIRHHNDNDDVVPNPDWRAAREWVKFAADGSYRPLKGEANLATGYALGPLSDRALIEALNALYPTAVANGVWFQAGTLTTTPFRETAARQTGMYRIVGSMTVEQLDDGGGRAL